MASRAGALSPVHRRPVPSTRASGGGGSRSAEHPVRDTMVGGAAKALILGQRLSPRLLDALMQTRGFEVHYTAEPKAEDASDNLHASLGYKAVEGSFSDRQHPRSLYTWLELRPAAKGIALAGAALGALALLRARS